LATQTGPQCREFYAALRHIGIAAGTTLRFRDISKADWKARFGRAAAALHGLPRALAASLLLAVGPFPGAAHAAIDGAKVRVELMARPGTASGAEQDFMVPNAGVLRTGDGVQLRLTSDIDAYVYVIAYGSSNTAVFLYPFSVRPDDALIRKGQTEFVPRSGVFLPLDDREGRETLFTIVSDVPLTDMADLLPRIEAHAGDVDAIIAMLSAENPSVASLSFKHIGATPLVGVATHTPRSSPSSPTSGLAGGGEKTDASPSPSASGDWSASSSRGFGASGAAAGAATASAREQSTSATSTTPAAQTPSARSGKLPAVDSAAETVTAPVSSALRNAREAAGIDESQFRGMLATLPDGSEAEVPESMRTSHTEQGVLGAEGSRIRAFGRAQAQSDEGWPSDDGGSQKKLQN
jgi:hypothetical protein